MLLLGFQFLKLGFIVKAANTYMSWEMLISITKFELCVKCSAHSETPGRRDDAVYFPHQSCLSLWGGGEPPLSWKSRQRHSTTTTPFPTCYRSHTPPPLSPSFYWLPSERRQSLCVQLQELPLRSDSTPCRFHLLLVVCAVKLFITLGSQLYRTHFLFYVDSSKPIRVSWPFINLLG